MLRDFKKKLVGYFNPEKIKDLKKDLKEELVDYFDLTKEPKIPYVNYFPCDGNNKNKNRINQNGSSAKEIISIIIMILGIIFFIDGIINGINNGNTSRYLESYLVIEDVVRPIVSVIYKVGGALTFAIGFLSYHSGDKTKKNCVPTEPSKSSDANSIPASNGLHGRNIKTVTDYSKITTYNVIVGYGEEERKVENIPVNCYKESKFFKVDEYDKMIKFVTGLKENNEAYTVIGYEDNLETPIRVEL